MIPDRPVSTVRSFEKVYENAADVHVRGTYVYVSFSDVAEVYYATRDAEGSTRLDAETLHDLFLKGLIVMTDSDHLYRPVSMTVDPLGFVCLNCIDYEAGEPPLVSIIQVYSAEYEAQSE